MKKFIEPEIEVICFDVKDQVANNILESDDLGEWN